MSLLEDFLNGPYGWLSILAIIIVFTAITIFFYLRKDKYDPEPVSRIVVAFIYGILSVIPAVILSFIAIVISFVLLGNFTPFVTAVVIAPVVEETVKLWFVIHISKHESFDGPLDGLIYGAMIGAGFAAAENVLYGVGTLIAEGVLASIGLTAIRSLFQILGHPFYTGLAGIGVGEFKVGLENSKYHRLRFSMILHGLWNLVSSIFINNTILLFGGLIVLLIISIIILRDELKKAIELDKEAFERGYYDRKQQFLEEKKQREQERLVQQPWSQQTRGVQQFGQPRQDQSWPSHFEPANTRSQPETAQRMPEEPRQVAHIKICNNCGSAGQKDDRYCRECGNELF